MFFIWYTCGIHVVVASGRAFRLGGVAIKSYGVGMSWCSKFLGLEKTVIRGDGGHKKGISGCIRGYLNL